jgi:nucleoside 2-deoxyribosyltransferase
MKVYIAAPWTHKADAARTAAMLEAAGHEVTKRWWEHREVPGYLTDDHANDGELREQAEEDVQGVCDADVFVLLNYAKSEGKAVETGVAIACGIPIIVVGRRSNLFHYLSVVVVTSVDALNRAIIDAAAA